MAEASKRRKKQARKKLTKRLVDSLSPRETVMDTEVPGLGVRANASGKVFVMTYKLNGKWVRNQVIAKYGEFTLEEARLLAQEYWSEIRRGNDPKPRATAEPEPVSFSDLADDFIKHYAKTRRKSWGTDEARIEKHLKPAFGAENAVEVTRSDIIALNNKIGTQDCKTPHCRARKKTCNGHPIEANRNVRLVQRIFEVGRDLGLGPESHPNPAARFRQYPFPEGKTHDRAATAPEVKRLRKAIDTTVNIEVRAVFWLLLLTGLRKREALTLHWDHVNLRGKSRVLKGRQKLEPKTAFIPENKSGRPFFLPLSLAVVDLLKSLPSKKGWVFPAESELGHLVSVDRQWRRVRDLAKVPGLTIHDLRATVASWASARGEHDRLINAMLNQSPPPGVVTRYVDDSPGRVREAFDKHANEVLKAAGVKKAVQLISPESGEQQGAKVIQLRAVK